MTFAVVALFLLSEKHCLDSSLRYRYYTALLYFLIVIAMLNDTEKRLKVAIYIRVSTKDQEEKYSIPHQENSIKRYVEARDRQLELADKKYLYYDRISWASDIDERKGLNDLFNDLKLAREMKVERPFDMVIVYRIDRFARKVKVLLNIVDSLQAYGVDFASCYESIDTSTAFGKAMLQIMGVFAELERDMITTKTHSGLREKKKAWWRAQEKYGYLRDHKHFPHIYEPEAKVIAWHVQVVCLWRPYHCSDM